MPRQTITFEVEWIDGSSRKNTLDLYNVTVGALLEEVDSYEDILSVDLNEEWTNND